jgi:hypothetical protein
MMGDDAGEMLCLRPPRAPRTVLSRPSLRAALCALALALAAAPAGAAPSEPKPNLADAALAEALFKEARELMRKKDYAAACPKFAESYRLDPAVGSELNLASCHELEGKIATAWGEYTDAASRALRANDKTREKFAREHADALEPRLPKLVLIMQDPPEGLTLSRDGATLSSASLGTPLPVDPGEHKIEAAAPGYKGWSQVIEAREGQPIRLEVPALEREPAPSKGAGAARPDPAGPAGGDAAGGGGRGRRIAGIVMGAVGIASLAAGGVFVGLTAAKKGSADETCDPKDQCDDTGYGQIEDARVFANVANITLGAGGALVIAGGILILTSGGGDPPPAAARGPRAPRSLSVLPAVGPEGAGVVARLRF